MLGEKKKIRCASTNKRRERNKKLDEEGLF